MQLVQQVQLKPTKLLDEVTFFSKNLFNVDTYTVRQRFFADRYWTRYAELWDGQPANPLPLGRGVFKNGLDLPYSKISRCAPLQTRMSS